MARTREEQVGGTEEQMIIRVGAEEFQSSEMSPEPWSSEEAGAFGTLPTPRYLLHPALLS